MFTVQVDRTVFNRMEKALMFAAGEKQVRYASAQALNDCARAASVQINSQMATVFDRPTRFTERAAVAPRDLAATPDRLAAVTTLRPIQAQYLLHEEQGGTRTPAENTRKPGAQALVLPGKTLPLDAHGNIPAGRLAELRRDAAAIAQGRTQRIKRQRQVIKTKRFFGLFGSRTRAVTTTSRTAIDAIVFLPADMRGNKAHIGGYFRRLPDHRLTRLTGFEATAHYQPRLHYFDAWRAVVTKTWPDAMRRRLQEAIHTAR